MLDEMKLGDDTAFRAAVQALRDDEAARRFFEQCDDESLEVESLQETLEAASRSSGFMQLRENTQYGVDDQKTTKKNEWPKKGAPVGTS